MIWLVCKTHTQSFFYFIIKFVLCMERYVEYAERSHRSYDDDDNQGGWFSDINLFELLIWRTVFFLWQK